MSTNIIQLSRDEYAAFVIEAAGQRYYRTADAQFFQILTAGKITTRYTDADDRPGDDSHDGNGWTERVREYTISAEPASSAALVAAADAYDLRNALANTDAAFVARMSAAERTSYHAALLLWWRSHRSPAPLKLVRGEDGLWVAQESQPEAPAEDDDWDTL